MNLNLIPARKEAKNNNSYIRGLVGSFDDRYLCLVNLKSSGD